MCLPKHGRSRYENQQRQSNPGFRTSQVEGRSSTLKMAFDGRMSTNDMPKEASDRIELLQGTLDMLILRTLLFGPAHGHQIAKHIQRTTEDVLQVEHGSLYPALHRLERKGWVSAKWEMAKDRNREFKYYRLTPAGKKQLVVEESRWKRLAGAIARLMWPAEEG
jgi:PadR family transcriptional regulator, regulatory protein PadR